MIVGRPLVGGIGLVISQLYSEWKLNKGGKRLLGCCGILKSKESKTEAMDFA